jgi:hypothetical protein
MVRRHTCLQWCGGDGAASPRTGADGWNRRCPFRFVILGRSSRAATSRRPEDPGRNVGEIRCGGGRALLASRVARPMRSGMDPMVFATAFVARKAKSLAFRPLRGPLLTLLRHRMTKMGRVQANRQRRRSAVWRDRIGAPSALSAAGQTWRGYRSACHWRSSLTGARTWNRCTGTRRARHSHRQDHAAVTAARAAARSGWMWKSLAKPLILKTSSTAVLMPASDSGVPVALLRRAASSRTRRPALEM